MLAKKALLLISCSVLLLANCYAGKEPKFDLKLYKKEADAAFADGSIFSAADIYMKILQHDSTQYSVLYNLAECYYLAKDYELASVYFAKSYKADPVKNGNSLYYQALTTKMQGRYTEAIALFKKFNKSSYQGEDASKLRRWAHIEIDGCNFALKESKPDPSVKFVHLGHEVNSNYADQAPALRNDELYFSSIHSDTVLTMQPGNTDVNKDSRLMKLYTSKVTDDTYAPAEQIKTFSQPGKHISNGSFSEDGNKFFYTICDGELLKPKCDIYMAEYDGTDWTKGKELNKEINLDGCTNTQPYLAKNSSGNETLYFVSDRIGGKGGTDIWCSVMNKKGEFGPPKNAGSKINSDRDEWSPFYDSKSSTLYFSSNGWIGMGGLDIFKAHSSGYEHFSTNPENLGAPFNSPCNDYYYRAGKSIYEGYMVSNRPGIFSVRGKTCCDDIFTWQYTSKVFLALKVRVFDDETKQPIEGAAVNLSLQSRNKDESDVVIGSDTTNGNPLLFNLKQQKLYKVAAMKSGFFTSSQTFGTEGVVKSDTQSIDIYLKKMEKNKAYRLNNIYYDFDKADLRPESKTTLDTLYKILIENPTIIIELSSHTDSRGADAYNLSLSQRRAESCVNYLINEKGIPKERITAKGYGKTKPIEDCSKYPDCPQTQSGDCPCHQLNRRTEFKIIGELDIKIINDNE